MNLSKELSSYLDLLRFVAAFAVLCGHMAVDGFAMEWLPLSDLAHEAVIIFFVLSGFIIAYTTAKKNRGGKQYFIARASRIYSVALPAVAFSVLCAFLAVTVYGVPGEALSNYRDIRGIDIASSLLFLNQSWFSVSDVTLNDPYWSMNYEVWYYIGFGLFMYLEGVKRLIFMGLFVVLAGPAILTLFPIWILGAIVATHGHKIRINQTIAPLILVLTFICVWGISVSGIDVAIKDEIRSHVPQLYLLLSSQRFATDYVIAGLVALNIIAFANMRGWFVTLCKDYQPQLAYLAGFSFTLYLFHRPFTQLGGYFFPQMENSITLSLLALVVITLACWAISFVTERQLPFWRGRMNALLSRV